MKTGDILLFSGTSELAETIQKFQSFEDEQSAKYNHSGIIYISNYCIYVIEASYIQQHKIKAAVVITKLVEYLQTNCEILLLESKEQNYDAILEKELFKYVGTPYDYKNLTLYQIVLKLTGFFLGPKYKSDKKFICHEFTQTVWHNVKGCFPNYYKGSVKDIFNSNHFTHKIYKEKTKEN